MAHYETIDLRTLRKERGWTQRQVAKMLGLKPSAYNRYELRVNKPREELIDDIAKLFNVKFLEVVLFFYQ
jgi:transcriptional regulator with XRE-family HTH domain